MKDCQTLQTSLRGIADRARRDPKARFRNVYMLLNEENLRECFRALRKDAAPGVDRVTFEDYERDLESNLSALVGQLKHKRYHARLVRRVNIPKGGGKLRPLGIPVLEDKRGSCKTLPNAGRQACIREGFAGIFDDAAGCRRTSGRNRAFPLLLGCFRADSAVPDRSLAGFRGV